MARRKNQRKRSVNNKKTQRKKQQQAQSEWNPDIAYVFDEILGYRKSESTGGEYLLRWQDSYGENGEIIKWDHSWSPAADVEKNYPAAALQFHKKNKTNLVMNQIFSYSPTTGCAVTYHGFEPEMTNNMSFDDLLLNQQHDREFMDFTNQITLDGIKALKKIQMFSSDRVIKHEVARKLKEIRNEIDDQLRCDDEYEYSIMSGRASSLASSEAMSTGVISIGNDVGSYTFSAFNAPDDTSSSDDNEVQPCFQVPISSRDGKLVKNGKRNLGQPTKLTVGHPPPTHHHHHQKHSDISRKNITFMQVRRNNEPKKDVIHLKRKRAENMMNTPRHFPPETDSEASVVNAFKQPTDFRKGFKCRSHGVKDSKMLNRKYQKNECMQTQSPCDTQMSNLSTSSLKSCYGHRPYNPFMKQ